jgi:hypothetical protein
MPRKSTQNDHGIPFPFISPPLRLRSARRRGSGPSGRGTYQCGKTGTPLASINARCIILSQTAPLRGGGGRGGRGADAASSERRRPQLQPAPVAAALLPQSPLSRCILPCRCPRGTRLRCVSLPRGRIETVPNEQQRQRPEHCDHERGGRQGPSVRGLKVQSGSRVSGAVPHVRFLLILLPPRGGRSLVSLPTTLRRLTSSG